MRFFLLLLITVFVSVSVSFDVKADQAFSHCEDAESSADSMVCVKERYDAAQIRLNAAFENVLDAQTSESMKALHLTQNEWLSYRDKECRWEIDQVENESLHRIEELSCLAMLTVQRADILEKSHTQQQEQDVKEYGMFPRWMNVVAKDHPKIFWRYDDFLSFDLDCDGQAEEIMLGQGVETPEVYSAGANPYVLQTVLVVAENPVSGRPQTQLLKINMSLDEEGGRPCDPNVELSIIDYPQSSENPVVDNVEAGVDAEAPHAEGVQCAQALQISGRWCKSSILFWNGAALEFRTVEN